MFFKKKSHTMKCARCSSVVKGDFSFCPYCGQRLISREQMEKDYGLLGKNDAIEEEIANDMGSMNLGITDKMINSMFNMVMKNLNKQMREDIEHAEITPLPNGIKISIGSPQRKKASTPKMIKKTLTEEQLQKIASLPRKEAKSTIKRFGDRIIYELAMPGVASTEDVFISKLESGYEIKALGSKNMYVNRMQISLPLKGIGIDKNKVLVEFKTEEN